jgi:predicted glycosyltransferase
MRIWIDLANSPHPLLFAPVSRALEERGHRVEITVRDHAQTLALARERWQGLDVVGRASPSGRVMKARAMADRVRALRAWARAHAPDLALSHNSYAQIAAARSTAIPAVTAMDFEHQPANHVAFRLADRVLLPEAYPRGTARSQGAIARKIWRYPGVKEALYVGDFEPDEDVLRRLGVEPSPEMAIVVARTPPTRALYHRSDNPLFADCLTELARRERVHCVILARYPEQVLSLASIRGTGLTVPQEAVDARSLMRQADLVLGAGGTMTREAALMGVPAVSVFRGRAPAVDRWLEEQGSLRRLTRADELPSARPGASRPLDPHDLRAKGKQALDRFLAAVEAPIDR